MNIIDAGYRLAAEGDNNIALFQVGTMGRAVRGNIHHLHAGIMTELEIPDHPYRERHSLPGNPEEAADNLAFPDKLSDDPARRSNPDDVLLRLPRALACPRNDNLPRGCNQNQTKPSDYRIEYH